jgi:hypothetical protein
MLQEHSRHLQQQLENITNDAAPTRKRPLTQAAARHSDKQNTPKHARIKTLLQDNRHNNIK